MQNFQSVYPLKRKALLGLDCQQSFHWNFGIKSAPLNTIRPSQYPQIVSVPRINIVVPSGKLKEINVNFRLYETIWAYQSRDWSPLLGLQFHRRLHECQSRIWGFLFPSMLTGGTVNPPGSQNWSQHCIDCLFRLAVFRRISRIVAYSTSNAQIHFSNPFCSTVSTEQIYRSFVQCVLTNRRTELQIDSTAENQELLESRDYIRYGLHQHIFVLFILTFVIEL